MLTCYVLLFLPHGRLIHLVSSLILLNDVSDVSFAVLGTSASPPVGVSSCKFKAGDSAVGAVNSCLVPRPCKMVVSSCICLSRLFSLSARGCKGSFTTWNLSRISWAPCTVKVKSCVAARLRNRKRFRVTREILQADN